MEIVQVQSYLHFWLIYLLHLRHSWWLWVLQTILITPRSHALLGEGDSDWVFWMGWRFWRLWTVRERMVWGKELGRARSSVKILRFGEQSLWADGYDRKGKWEYVKWRNFKTTVVNVSIALTTHATFKIIKSKWLFFNEKLMLPCFEVRNYILFYFFKLWK